MELSAEASEIINILEQSGYEAYAVGGCVRDSIIGIIPNDWDICTSALPQKVIELFSAYKVIQTGIKHGTVTVLVNGVNIEVTTYRIEEEYEDNRRPSCVSFVGSLKEDLARRDFTMNALAYNPNTGLVDYFGGVSDIEKKIIKCVGEPAERMEEDALRLLRALRFASRFGFAIEGDLSNCIHRLKYLLLNISSERIQNEFNGILLGQNAYVILDEYKDVINKFIPEIEYMFGFEQNNPYHYLDVWHHTIESVQVASHDLVIKLTMFFHDIGKPATYSMDENGGSHFYRHAAKSVEVTETVLNRLKYSNKIISDVLVLIKYHDIKLTEKSLLNWMNKLGERRIDLLLQVMTADIKAQSPRFFDERMEQLEELKELYDEIIVNNRCYKISDLDIDGQDLIDMGFSEGRLIGEILEKLLELVMDGEVRNVRNSLITYIHNTKSILKLNSIDSD